MYFHDMLCRDWICLVYRRSQEMQTRHRFWWQLRRTSSVPTSSNGSSTISTSCFATKAARTSRWPWRWSSRRWTVISLLNTFRSLEGISSFATNRPVGSGAEAGGIRTFTSMSVLGVYTRKAFIFYSRQITNFLFLFMK